MVEYRAQIRRRHPAARIVQVVLGLGDDLALPDRYEDPDGSMLVRWNVVRVADLDRTRLLGSATTAPLAPLAAGSQGERAAALTAAVETITRVDPSRHRRLVDAAATLASIHLPLPIIETALQEATMPVPIRDLPLARALLDEGRAEGRAEATRAMSRTLLRHRFGDDQRVEAVAEALADLPTEEAADKIMRAERLDDLLY